MNSKAINIKEYNYQYQYNQFLLYTEDFHKLNEISLPSTVKKKIDFIKEISDKVGMSFKEAVNFFRDSRVYKFFTTIHWSFKRLYDIVKRGFKAYQTIIGLIPKYIADSNVGKWSEDKLRALDKWLQNNPKIKALGGVAVSGILIFIWLNMSFTGDITYDMNFDDVIEALSGNYSLSDLFAGEEGLKMLMLLITGGALGLSFPWAGATSHHFIGGVLVSLAKKLNKKIKTTKGI